jgi:hypothetical protein
MSLTKQQLEVRRAARNISKAARQERKRLQNRRDIQQAISALMRSYRRNNHSSAKA